VPGSPSGAGQPHRRLHLTPFSNSNTKRYRPNEFVHNWTSDGLPRWMEMLKQTSTLKTGKLLALCTFTGSVECIGRHWNVKLITPCTSISLCCWCQQPDLLRMTRFTGSIRLRRSYRDMDTMQYACNIKIFDTMYRAMTNDGIIMTFSSNRAYELYKQHTKFVSTVLHFNKLSTQAQTYVVGKCISIAHKIIITMCCKLICSK